MNTTKSSRSTPVIARYTRSGKVLAHYTFSRDFRLLSCISRTHALVSRSQWQRGPSRCSAAARVLGLWVWIPPGAWLSISCGCFVSSGWCLCVGLITRLEKSYRVWCPWVWLWSFDSEKTLAHFGVVKPWKKICWCVYETGRQEREATNKPINAKLKNFTTQCAANGTGFLIIIQDPSLPEDRVFLICLFVVL
jgi:hypothetical protein